MSKANRWSSRRHRDAQLGALGHELLAEALSVVASSTNQTRPVR